MTARSARSQALTPEHARVKVIRSSPVGLRVRRLGVLRSEEIDPLLRREGTSRNGWQPTADALFTMRFKRQPVAARGNGLALGQAGLDLR